MSKVQFTYYGIPTGKGRARVSTRGGFARAYTPKKTQEAEQNLQAQAAQYRPETLMDGAIAMTLFIHVPIPKSFTKKTRALIERNEARPTTKPDIDNIIKLVCDALNGVIWVDDKQIVALVVQKFYSESPRIEFVIEEI